MFLSAVATRRLACVSPCLKLTCFPSLCHLTILCTFLAFSMEDINLKPISVYFRKPEICRCQFCFYVLFSLLSQISGGYYSKFFFLRLYSENCHVLCFLFLSCVHVVHILIIIIINYSPLCAAWEDLAS